MPKKIIFFHAFAAVGSIALWAADVQNLPEQWVGRLAAFAIYSTITLPITFAVFCLFKAMAALKEEPKPRRRR